MRIVRLPHERTHPHVNVVVVPEIWTSERHFQQIASVDPGVHVIRGDHKRLADLVADVDVIAGGLPRLLFPRARRLRWLHLFSAGAESALYPEMLASDVLLTCAKGAHAIPMAEHAIMFMLMLQRHMGQFLRWQREHRWGREWLHELTGKTLLIVGLGAVGREIARKAKAFDMRVFGTKRNPATVPNVDRVGGPDALRALLPEADFVVVTAPNTTETRGAIGQGELRLMKQDAFLINVSRGAVVDQGALERALHDGWIAGAGLDTVALEPLAADSPLWDMENVFITPHNSAATWNIGQRIVDRFCENLRRFLRGEPLLNLVDKQAGY